MLDSTIAAPFQCYQHATRQEEIAMRPFTRSFGLVFLATLAAVTAQAESIRAGHYVEAELHSNRAIAISQKSPGADHPDTAEKLHNQALLYYSQGKYAEAEPLFKRALAIREKALGADHPL